MYYSTNLGTPVVWESFYFERDLLGNITAISINGSQTNRYVYDDIGQLICEDDILKGSFNTIYYDDWRRE